MKKYLIAAVAMLCFTISAYALDNEPEEGITWQAQAGINLSNLRTSGTAENLWGYYGTKPGATVSAMGRYVLPNCHGVFAKFGLQYNMLGAKGTHDGLLPNTELSEKTTLHYLNVPVHFGFQYGINNLWAVYADFGPYIGMGVAGKKTTKTYLNDIFDEKNSIRWYGSSDEKMRRFDWGLGFNVGTEYLDHYLFNLGVDWGMYNQLKDAPFYTKDSYMKNLNVSLTFGYRL